MTNFGTILNVDCLEGLKSVDDNSVDCIVTSPPYNKKGLLGASKHGNQIWGKFNIDYSSYGDNLPEGAYKKWMVDVLNECWRVIKDDGSIFFNHKPRRHKNRCYLPTDFIQDCSAKLYQLIIWDRRNSPNIRNDILVPSTEHIYWLCKNKPKVYRDSISTEFKGEVWVIPPERQSGHPAPFPFQLVENCVLLTTQPGDMVLDPFLGSGTTAVVAEKFHRKWLGFEIDTNYIGQAEQRISRIR